MADLMYCLTNSLFFVIPLLSYVNLNSSIICCLSSGDIYIYFGISLLASFECALFSCNFIEEFFFFNFISNFITN